VQPLFLGVVATMLLLRPGYTMHLVWFAALVPQLASAQLSKGSVEPDRPEVRTLCRKHQGTIAWAHTTPVVHLTCDHIRRQFSRQLSKTVNEGTLFGRFRSMVYSIRHRKLNDLAIDGCRTSEKKDGAFFTCTTVDSGLVVTIEVLGTPSGQVTKAVMTSTTDWFKKIAVENVIAELGHVPTDAFLDYYIDLLIATSNIVGGQDEKYSRSGTRVSVTVTVR